MLEQRVKQTAQSGAPQTGVSIVIPAFNDRAALRGLLVELQQSLALASELTMTARNSAGEAGQSLCRVDWEIIVVEGWTAGLPSVKPLAQDRALAQQWLHCEANRARQLQAGAEVAKYAVLWFLHADTSSISAAADWLRNRVELLGASAPDQFWGRFDVRLDSPRWTLKTVARLMNWRSRWSGICTGDQGIFVAAALLADVGGWPDQPLMEDVELSSRLKAVVRPLTPAAALVTSARRWQNHGVLRTIILMWRLRLSYFFGACPQELQALYNPSASQSADHSLPDTTPPASRLPR